MRVGDVARRIGDGLVNLASSIGTGKDKAVQYRSQWTQADRGEIEALYLSDWLGRKCIDTIPGDMVREWRAWEVKNAELLAEEEKKLRLREHVLAALTWADLYGGAAILIGDGAPDPTQPFEPNSVGRGGIQYLHTFSRYELAQGDVERDIMSPDFGKPKTYRIQATGADSHVEVHRSRFILFYGADAPRQFRDLNEGWGLSKFESIRGAIVNAGGSIANAAALTEEAKIDVVSIPDLSTYMQTPDGEQAIIKRFGAAMQMKSTINTLLLGTGEEFSRKQVSFTGLPELIRTHLDVAAGASEIPVTRLLGVSPRGLSGKGDHETRNYYDRVRSRQTGQLTACLEPFDTALLRHTFGNTPRNATYSWVPLWQMTPEEKAAVEKTQADTDAVYAGMGVFPANGFAKTIRDRLISEKTYPTIDTNLLPEVLEKLGDAPLKAVAPKGKDENPLEKSAASVADAAPRSLYIHRKVENAAEIISWAKAQGFEKTLQASDFHVTIAYSKAAIDWFAVGTDQEKIIVPRGGPRAIDRFDGGAVVLLISDWSLSWRWESLRDRGASWDHDGYQPHVTISYDAADVDLSKVKPYQGRIVLGPEIFAEVNDEWKSKAEA